jgi:hypothetical protein
MQAKAVLGTGREKRNGKIHETTPTLRACHDNISLWQLFPHLTNNGIDDPRDGYPRNLVTRLSRTATAPETPRHRFGVPMGCYVAHAIVWRRRLAFLAMEQAHSGAVSARQTRLLCRCFVQAKWRSSKKAKTSAFRSSKQGVVIFLLLRFCWSCYWSGKPARSCVMNTNASSRVTNVVEGKVYV